MALDPNIILAAGRGPTIDPASILESGNRIALGRLAALRGRQTQDALDRVRASPDDPDAVTALAALDPAAGQAYLASQAAKRAGITRANQGALVRSLAGQSAPVAPVQPVAPVAPTTATLPGTGASISLPAPDQPSPAAAQLAHTSPAMVATGQAVASGMSPSEAAARVVESGGADALNEVVKSYNGLDDVRKAKLSEANDAAGRAALSLLSVPPSQRQAALAQLAPDLAQHFITPDKLGDLSDTTLHGVVGQATTVAEGIKQANSDRDYALDLRKQTETERHNKAGEDSDRGKVVPFGSTYVGADGKVLFDNSGNTTAPTGRTTGGWTPRTSNGGDNSDAAVDGKIAGAAKFLGVDPTADISKLSPMQIAQAMTLSEGGKGSLADKNNNPANLRNSDGSYKRFPTKQAGLDAAAALVSRKLAAGQTTVQTMIEGLPARGSGGASGAGGMTAAAIDLAARQGIANGGNVPAGYSRNKAAQAAIANRMAELAQGKSAGDLIQAGQDVKSQGNAFKIFNTNKPGTGGFQVRTFNVANAHLDQLGKVSQALASGDTPLINRLAQGYATATGQPAPTNFNTIKAYVSVEVLKAIEGGIGGVGDREEAKGILSAAQSPAQLSGAIKQIQGLMIGQLDGVRQSYETSTGRQDFQRYLSPRSNAMLAAHTGSRPTGTLSPRSASSHPSDIEAILAKYR